MNAEGQILAGSFEGFLWIRVVGKGSFQNSPAMKSYIDQSQAEGSLVIVDLEACTGLDSTFMGTLTGLALRAREQNRGDLQVVNADKRNFRLLKGLGLDQIFPVRPDVGDFSAQQKQVCHALEEADRKASCQEERARHMLEAHEALGEVDEENKGRFRDVVSLLRESLD
ncbi:MAG: STAS domain-containing protein [Verrucomicrobiota bacterium]